MIPKSFLRTIPATAALLGATLFSSPQMAIAADSQFLVSSFPVENVVADQLRELRSLTAQLNTDADQLHSLRSSGLHWTTHAVHLTSVKNHVNRIGDQLETLEAMRSIAAPWQQDAIDAIVPVALQVAGQTTWAINHLNENRPYLWAPEYSDSLRSISALSDQMHGLVDNHLKIIEARNKLQTLEEKLAERSL